MFHVGDDPTVELIVKNIGPCLSILLSLSWNTLFSIISNDSDMYQLLRILFEKKNLQKEHQDVLFNLSEALFSFDTGGLKYFNQLGKKILYQCVENKEDMVPNGVLLETL